LVTALGGPSGVAIAEALARRGVDVVDLGRSRPSPTKQRVVVEGRSLLRIDEHDERELPTPTGAQAQQVATLFAGAAVVIASDYGRGVLEVGAVRDGLMRCGRPVLWDPHPSGPVPVRGCTIVTPNERELAGSDGGGAELRDTIAAASRHAARVACGVVAVTRGPLGALTVDASGTATVLAPPDGPSPTAVDPCGAGDALVAAVAAALAQGALPIEAVAAGVERASTFVRAGGIRPWWSPRRGGRREHEAYGANEHEAGWPARTVATSGCFDLLHPGHVSLLEGARRLGDRLVVLLNSDESVRRLKGPSRPIQVAHDRAAVLRSLVAVDEVVIFDEDTPEVALAELAPDVYVKGGDYAHGDLPEAAVVAAGGGATVVLPYVGGRSTSALIERALDGPVPETPSPAPAR
jgi:rfaE bifunctional protein nucleotidyltransferase chain/domain